MHEVEKVMVLENARIAVIGLGYVGLPLAVEFGRHFDVVGFDINASRVEELQGGSDSTLEVEPDKLTAATRLTCTSDMEALRPCNVFIITVPTPVDTAHRPDFDPLLKASESIGKVLGKGDIVIYESTVYPGVTEEVCVPQLESSSGLVFNRDFHCGYSPERINPGDKKNQLTTITKVVSGSTPDTCVFVKALYDRIITAGTHAVSSIRVAEASKVIENTQRDVNIALMNELARIFHKVGIDTQEVLQAAETKWNFLPFKPGLVGGHCIGVDPYYLAHKAAMLGYNPELILSARRINDEMGGYVATRLMRMMARRRIDIVGSRILILGLTFKENCPDLRNTKVVSIIEELRAANAEVDVHDPWVDPESAHSICDVDLIVEPAPGEYDAVVLAVAHRQFLDEHVKSGLNIQGLLRPDGVVFDVRGCVPMDENVERL